MTPLCGAAGSETCLIMRKITLVQSMLCQAMRQWRCLSVQFRCLWDNWKQQWHLRDHNQSRGNWTACFSSLYGMLCLVLMCAWKRGRGHIWKLHYNTQYNIYCPHAFNPLTQTDSKSMSIVPYTDRLFILISILFCQSKTIGNKVALIPRGCQSFNIKG